MYLDLEPIGVFVNKSADFPSDHMLSE